MSRNSGRIPVHVAPSATGSICRRRKDYSNLRGRVDSSDRRSAISAMARTAIRVGVTPADAHPRLPHGDGGFAVGCLP
jgi:hypothetical protein